MTLGSRIVQVTVMSYVPPKRSAAVPLARWAPLVTGEESSPLRAPRVPVVRRGPSPGPGNSVVPGWT